MYTVSADRAVQISTVPQSSVGAPCPMVLAGEHSLHLAYYLEDVPADWDGTAVRLLSDSEGDEPCALVEFDMVYAHFFGPPNDEAFDGHPLAARGLHPYAVFQVHESTWLHSLERMNSVHPHHTPERFAKHKHFIFTFHDSTFECIAESFSLSICRGNVRSVLLGGANEA